MPFCARKAPVRRYNGGQARDERCETSRPAPLRTRSEERTCLDVREDLRGQTACRGTMHRAPTRIFLPHKPQMPKRCPLLRPRWGELRVETAAGSGWGASPPRTSLIRDHPIPQSVACTGRIQSTIEPCLMAARKGRSSRCTAAAHPLSWILSLSLDRFPLGGCRLTSILSLSRLSLSLAVWFGQ